MDKYAKKITIIIGELKTETTFEKKFTYFDVDLQEIIDMFRLVLLEMGWGDDVARGLRYLNENELEKFFPKTEYGEPQIVQGKDY